MSLTDRTVHDLTATEKKRIESREAYETTHRALQYSGSVVRYGVRGYRH